MVSDDMPAVILTAADIPGADLSELYKKHTVAALRWWLLCRDIKAPRANLLKSMSTYVGNVD